MALPNRKTLEETLREARQAWAGVKRLADAQIARYAAGPTEAHHIIDAGKQLVSYRATLSAVASTTGIAAYAQQQYADDQYDIAADFTAMISAIDAVVTWVHGNFPKDANGWLLKEKLALDMTTTERTFTTASLAALTALWQALSATIE